MYVTHFNGLAGLLAREECKCFGCGETGGNAIQAATMMATYM